MQRQLTIVAVVSIAALMGAPLAALDFDGDGIADLPGFENQNDGSPNELAFTSILSGSSQSSRVEFGAAHEFAVPGDYDGDGITDLAAVGADYSSSETGVLVWRTKLAGEVVTQEFGAVGDTVISGCSFDGDSITDRTFFRDGTLHVLKSTDSTEATIATGRTDLQQVSCGDLNGDGAAELVGQAMVVSGGSSQSYFFAWNLAGEQQLELAFGAGVKQIFVADIDGDGSQNIGYRRDRDGFGRKLIFRVGDLTQSFSLPRFSAVSFGRFVAGSPIEGVLLKIPADDRFQRYDVLGGSSVPVTIRGTTTVLPAVNTIEVGPTRSQEAGCDVHDEPQDGANGFLWKPVSHSQGSVVVLTDRSKRFRRMRAIKDGVVLERFRFDTRGPGTRDFFRSRKLYSYFPSYFTLQMRGGDGLMHCVLIPDPSLRYD